MRYEYGYMQTGVRFPIWTSRGSAATLKEANQKARELPIRIGWERTVIDTQT